MFMQQVGHHFMSYILIACRDACGQECCGQAGLDRVSKHTAYLAQERQMLMLFLSTAPLLMRHLHFTSEPSHPIRSEQCVFSKSVFLFITRHPQHSACIQAISLSAPYQLCMLCLGSKVCAASFHSLFKILLFLESGIHKTVETLGACQEYVLEVRGIQIIREEGRRTLYIRQIKKTQCGLLLRFLRCLHPSLDHEFMPFWQQLSTTNITILCLSFKVKYSAAFKCNAGAPTGSELSIRQLELERIIFQLFQQKIRQTLF